MISFCYKTLAVMEEDYQFGGVQCWIVTIKMEDFVLNIWMSN